MVLVKTPHDVFFFFFEKKTRRLGMTTNSQPSFLAFWTFLCFCWDVLQTLNRVVVWITAFDVSNMFFVVLFFLVRVFATEPTCFPFVKRFE